MQPAQQQQPPQQPPQQQQPAQQPAQQSRGYPPAQQLQISKNEFHPARPQNVPLYAPTINNNYTTQPRESAQSGDLNSEQPIGKPQLGRSFATLGAYSPMQSTNFTASMQGLNISATNVNTAMPIQFNLMTGPPAISLFLQTSVPPLVNRESVTTSEFSNADPKYKRCTLNCIPKSASLLEKSKIPFGLVITPYRQLLDGDPPIPLINSPQIIRCRRCRTYINPWVTFVEGGGRWKCNVCGLANEGILFIIFSSIIL
jgi:protein transport protein SEC24